MLFSHSKISTSLIILGFLTLFSCNQQKPENAADWILRNGKILTVDENFSQVQAMAIKDGKIIATGSNDDIESFIGADTKKTDLEGKTVIPGLIDNHMHFVRATKHWYRSVRWDGVKSRAQAISMLQERDSVLPKGEWIVVMGGFVFPQFKDNSEKFSVEELDSLFPNRPIYIQEGYRRAFANTAAFKVAGIDKNTVFDGLITDASGELTGELAGNSRDLVFDKIAEPSDETWDASIKMTIDSLLSKGLTAVYDLGGSTVTPAFYEAVKKLAIADDLDMRVFYSLNSKNSKAGSAEEIIGELKANTPDYDGLRFAQFGYGESIYAPLRARTNPFSISEKDEEYLKDIVVTATENKWQLHEHSARNDKINVMLNILEDVAKTHPEFKETRFTVAHTDGISKENIKRAMDLNMTFATHCSSRQMSVEDIKQHPTPPPIGTINKMGGIWGLGSDGTTVASPNPFHSIGWVVSGQNIVGNVTFKDTVSREDALRAHTATNGYLLFRENHLGSLETGKQADFVVLNKDYMKVPASEIENLYSLMTAVEGEIVYQSNNKSLTTKN